MPQESGQIVEGIDTVYPAAGNEAHEEVCDPRSPKGLEEEGVFSMEDALFEHPFANVVIQGGVGDPQEKGQREPVVEHILNGFAHAGVGFSGFL